VNVDNMLKEIATWPVNEQLELVQGAWEQLLKSGWQPSPTDEDWAEIERRLDDDDANPGNVLTWEQIEAHLKRAR
jgi:putative addiction module component (TIGR02574 family)